MVDKITHLPIHWIDGMKISKGHFIGVQNFTIDAIRDAVGSHISMLNYGLLPTDEPIKIHLVIDSHQLLRVKVEKCQGLTPNGSRIEIHYSGVDKLESSIAYPEVVKKLQEGEEAVLLACISVDLFDRVPCGEPDPSENPPRDPYTRANYKLHLLSEEQLRNEVGVGHNYLIVGRIYVSGSNSYIDEHYIPPCVVVASHYKLRDLYYQIDRFYGQMELYSVQIEQKIRTKNQTNVLAMMLMKMIDKMLHYLGREINVFRWLSLYAPPVQMLVSVVGFARVLKNFVDAHSGSGKEELLNYFSDWCKITPGDFEAIFSQVINTEYNHNKIGETVTKVVRFMEIFEELFAILNRLDYIGKKRDGSIFVAEVLQDKSNVSSQRSRTFLAD